MTLTKDEIRYTGKRYSVNLERRDREAVIEFAANSVMYKLPAFLLPPRDLAFRSPDSLPECDNRLLAFDAHHQCFRVSLRNIEAENPVGKGAHGPASRYTLVLMLLANACSQL